MIKKIIFAFVAILFIFYLAETSSAQFNYYINDHLGNTRVVVDEQGNVKEYYDYYPFGKTLRSSITGEQVTTYKFTGKELDDENNLNWYYFGVRYYDAEIGRWLSVEPLADKYPSISPYVYCLNNALKNIDPDGRKVKISTNANTPQGFKENFIKLASQMRIYQKLHNNPFILVNVLGSTDFNPSSPTAAGQFLPKGEFREAPQLLKDLGSFGAFIWGSEFSGDIKYKSNIVENIASGNFTTKDVAIVFHEFTHALLEYENKGNFFGGSITAEEVEVYKRMLNKYGDQLTDDERAFWESVLQDYEIQLEKEKSDDQEN